jgi:glucosamine--fructose-6-phosphate aminotransferase (isomerizing)
MKHEPLGPGHLMAAEMAEQPETLARLIARRHEIARVTTPLFSEGLTGTVIVARGSSDHAATTGRYLLEMATRRPVMSASPSLETLYQSEVDYSGYVVIAVSQSGRTPEIATVLEAAASRGARTIVITNDPASPLARVADAVVDLAAGQERAVPATKTVTAEMVGFGLIAAGVSERAAPSAASWEALPTQVHQVLGDRGPVQELVSWFTATGSDRLAAVGRGPMTGAAAETALKLQETSSLLATAFSAADLRHGPIALSSSGIPVLAFAHPGPASEEVVDLARELAERGADVRIVGPVPGTACSWPVAAPESLAPVFAVVRGQQLALLLALLRGLDPDAPVGLTKVTVT